MNINKGSKGLNCIFGIFIVLSTIKITGDLYGKYKEKSKMKDCGCNKK